jgi:hypothetical protein
MGTPTFAKWALCIASLYGAPGMAVAAESPVQAEASLVRGLPAATNTEIDGVNWHCQREKCVATAKRPPPATIATCRKVAAALGQLASFSSRGRELSKEELQSCNRAAR